MQFETTNREDPVYSDQKIQGLLKSINEASSGASSGWILFISTMAYFFIALAGVSHEDFLLNSAVNQPVLQVEVDLHLFFLFAPLVLLFVHFGILIQHETLASKVRAFDHAMFAYEGAENYRAHPIRRELSGYFFTQSIAGPRRSRILLLFLNLMSWVTLYVLPIVTLIAFQVTYLAYHDSDVTFWHRVYLVADIGVFLIMGTLYRFLDGGFITGLSKDIRYHTGSFIVNNFVAVIAIFFAFFVATLPDSSTDIMMRKLWPTPVPYGWEPKLDDEKPRRYAFLPTAYLFEGKVNEGSGTTDSVFSRNLVVTDKDLVKDSTWNKNETTLSLRARNLSYATFDRSDMRGTDFTNSMLHGARFYKTNLNTVKFDHANLQKADMREALFAGKTSMFKANLMGADLRGSKFEELEMRQANLQGANLQNITGVSGTETYVKYLNLEGANLQFAQLQRANLTRGILRGANLRGANMQGTVFENAHLQGADFTDADLTGAHLVLADLSGAVLKRANLQGAALNNAKLYGVDLEGTTLRGSYFRKAKVWYVKALTLNQLELTDLRDLELKPARDYYGEFNILRRIEDKNVRALVKQRLGPLLVRQKKLDWNTTKDFAAWDALKDQKPDTEKVTNFFIKGVCGDETPKGFIAKAYVFRLERRYAEYGSYYQYKTYQPPVNPERFLNEISEDKCGGSTSVTPTAMYQLMKTVSKYRNDLEKVNKWRKKNNIKVEPKPAKVEVKPAPKQTEPKEAVIPKVNTAVD